MYTISAPRVQMSLYCCNGSFSFRGFLFLLPPLLLWCVCVCVWGGVTRERHT